MGMYDMCKNPQPIDTDVSYRWKDIVKWIGEACRSDGTKKKKKYLDNAAPADARTITIGQIPRGYVDSHGDMVVRTPKGVKTTLQEAYENYNQTPVAVENIPGLTDYLIKQDNQDIQEAAHMRKRAGDRFVHQLGEKKR